jgi:hypothetical protein
MRAVWHAQVTNNVSRAEQLSTQADDLEEMIAKEFQDKSSQVVMFQAGETLDLSREDMGVITVSQSISALGMIERYERLGSGWYAAAAALDTRTTTAGVPACCGGHWRCGVSL